MAKVVREKGDVDLESLKLRIAELDRYKLIVGWFESARYDDSTPVAGVAAVQELGAPNRSIPSHPFLRPTVANKRKDWVKFLEGQFKDALDGSTTTEDALNRLGLIAAGQIKKTISVIKQPPLSPITLALRKRKKLGLPISGAIVGAVAAAIAEGKTDPGELGDSSGVSTKPLIDTSFMLVSLTHEVSTK